MQGLAIFEELGDLVGQGNALNNLGIAAYYRGDWAEALEHYEASRRVRERCGDVVGTATEENNIAEILSDQGDLEAARRTFSFARATWSAAGYRVGVALATSNLGRLAARAGDVALGRRLLKAALDEFQGMRSMLFAAEAEVRLAECQLLDGDFANAVAACDDLLGRLRAHAGLEQSEVAALRVLGTAKALAALSDPATGGAVTAPAALEEAIERAAALDAPYELALCLATTAIVDGLRKDRDASAQLDGWAAVNRARAGDIFDRLGVTRAVVTWSTRAQGGPSSPAGMPRRGSRPTSPNCGQIATATAHHYDVPMLSGWLAH